MTRTPGLMCCASLLALHPVLVVAGAGQAPVAEASATVTATIEAIDKTNRTLTLKPPKGASVEIKAPEQMEGFNNLRVGDQVTATYFEAVAVNVRKPGDPPASGDFTATLRKDRIPGSETRKQQTFTVTVVAVDPKVPSLTVKAPDGRVVALALRDAKQVQNLKAGDTVDVTYFESLLIKVARPPK
jgi:hypothetical protein